MDIEELYGHVHIFIGDIVQLLVLNMVEFLKSDVVIDLLPKFAKTVPEFLISDTVPELMISNTVPDSLMPNVGPRYLAYYYCYYYSVLCRKALLAIVYCTRSNKIFLLY